MATALLAVKVVFLIYFAPDAPGRCPVRFLNGLKWFTNSKKLGGHTQLIRQANPSKFASKSIDDSA